MLCDHRKRTINLAYDIIYEEEEVIDSFTTLGNDDNLHIIVTTVSNSYLYIFQYPSQVTCINDILFVGQHETTINYDVESRLTMTITRELRGVNMIELNEIANFDDSYIATIEVDSSYENENMMFMFVDENAFYYNHDCNTTIIFCNDKCEVCSEIPDDKTSHPTQCDTCLTGYYPLIDVEPLDCYGNSETVPNYYFDTNANVFKKCHEKCETCSGSFTDRNMNCVTCKSPYSRIEAQNGEIGCLICASGGSPSYDYSINTTGCIYESANKCPTTIPFYVSNKKQCYYECPSDK